jgi:hypothetical protein
VFSASSLFGSHGPDLWELNTAQLKNKLKQKNIKVSSFKKMEMVSALAKKMMEEEEQSDGHDAASGQQPMEKEEKRDGHDAASGQQPAPSASAAGGPRVGGDNSCPSTPRQAGKCMPKTLDVDVSAAADTLQSLLEYLRKRNLPEDSTEAQASFRLLWIPFELILTSIASSLGVYVDEHLMQATKAIRAPQKGKTTDKLSPVERRVDLGVANTMSLLFALFENSRITKANKSDNITHYWGDFAKVRTNAVCQFATSGSEETKDVPPKMVVGNMGFRDDNSRVFEWYHMEELTLTRANGKSVRFPCVRRHELSVCDLPNVFESFI